MHRHILIPTDGSELSQNAIDYGMALAKSVDAKVTVLTVSTPFQTFAVLAGLITDTPEKYKKRMVTLAAKYLNTAKEAAMAAGVSCETMHIEHDQPYRRHHRDGGTKIVRSDCHGFAWAARNFRDRTRE